MSSPPGGPGSDPPLRRGRVAPSLKPPHRLDRMPHRHLGHLQKSVLDLARRHEGRVAADLVYQELFAAQASERNRIDSSTRNSISRVLWSLQKRGLIKQVADRSGFELVSSDERRD
jgi:hypothetical protein